WRGRRTTASRNPPPSHFLLVDKPRRSGRQDMARRRDRITQQQCPQFHHEAAITAFEVPIAQPRPAQSVLITADAVQVDAMLHRQCTLRRETGLGGFFLTPGHVWNIEALRGPDEMSAAEGESTREVDILQPPLVGIESTDRLEGLAARKQRTRRHARAVK